MLVAGELQYGLFLCKDISLRAKILASCRISREFYVSLLFIHFRRELTL